MRDGEVSFCDLRCGTALSAQYPTQLLSVHTQPLAQGLAITQWVHASSSSSLSLQHCTVGSKLDAMAEPYMCPGNWLLGHIGGAATHRDYPSSALTPRPYGCSHTARLWHAGGPKEPNAPPHDDKWRPPHGMSIVGHISWFLVDTTIWVCPGLLCCQHFADSAVGFGPGPSMRDAPGFGHTGGFGSPAGHAFPEHRGDPTPAGTGRGFAIGRGRAPQGEHTACVQP